MEAAGDAVSSAAGNSGVVERGADGTTGAGDAEGAGGAGPAEGSRRSDESGRTGDREGKARASLHSSGAQPHVRREAALEALLFRPVQRMCLYPLLFQQAVRLQSSILQTKEDEVDDGGDTARGRVAGGGATGGEAASGGEAALVGEVASGAPAGLDAELQLKEQLDTVFRTVQQTLGKVNSQVRTFEARQRTMQVLHHKVHGGDALVTPDRVLRYECHVDMRPVHDSNLAQICGFLSFTKAVVRRRYKWYVFSDAVLICRQRSIYEFLMPNELQVVLPKEGDHLPPPRTSSAHDASAFFSFTSQRQGANAQRYESWAEDELQAKMLEQEIRQVQEQAAARLRRPCNDFVGEGDASVE